MTNDRQREFRITGGRTQHPDGQRAVILIAVGYTAVIWAIGALKLSLGLESSVFSAALMSFVYAAVSFVIWRVNLAVSFPFGGLLLFVMAFMGIVRLESAAHAVRDLAVSLGMLCVCVLLAVILPPWASRRNGSKRSFEQSPPLGPRGQIR